MVALERVRIGGSLFQRRRVDVELQAEFLEEFVTPLFDETALALRSEFCARRPA
jgi:hypothetical protein